MWSTRKPTDQVVRVDLVALRARPPRGKATAAQHEPAPGRTIRERRKFVIRSFEGRLSGWGVRWRSKPAQVERRRTVSAPPGWRPPARWPAARGTIGPRQTIRQVICATHTAWRRRLRWQRRGQPGPVPRRRPRTRSASARRPAPRRRPCRSCSTSRHSTSDQQRVGLHVEARAEFAGQRRCGAPAAPSTASSSAAIVASDDQQPQRRHRRARWLAEPAASSAISAQPRQRHAVGRAEARSAGAMWPRRPAPDQRRPTAIHGHRLDA